MWFNLNSSDEDDCTEDVHAPLAVEAIEATEQTTADGGGEDSGGEGSDREGCGGEGCSPHGLEPGDPRIGTPWASYDHARSCIGKRIKLWWDGDEQWFKGTIKQVSARDHSVMVRYDDGQGKWHSMWQEEYEFLSVGDRSESARSVVDTGEGPCLRSQGSEDAVGVARRVAEYLQGGDEEACDDESDVEQEVEHEAEHEVEHEAEHEVVHEVEPAVGIGMVESKAKGLKLHLQKGSSTGYRGVCRVSGGRYQAQYWQGGRVWYVGRFATAKEAAIAIVLRIGPSREEQDDRDEENDDAAAEAEGEGEGEHHEGQACHTEQARVGVGRPEAAGGVKLHLSEHNRTGYVGVRAKGSHFQAMYSHVHLGTFRSAKEAAVAYAKHLAGANHKAAAATDEVACSECGGLEPHPDDEILLCDGAGYERAYHMRCLKPIVTTMPMGDWLCPHCIDQQPAQGAAAEFDNLHLSGFKGNSSTGYKGVYAKQDIANTTHPFMAACTKSGGMIGRYTTAIEAAKAFSMHECPACTGTADSSDAHQSQAGGGTEAQASPSEGAEQEADPEVRESREAQPPKIDCSAAQGIDGRMAAVNARLQAMGLAQYVEAFAAQGFDDLHWLRGLSKAKLEEIGRAVGMRQGHAMRFADQLNEE